MGVLNRTLGSEVMRVDFAANGDIADIKKEYAALCDKGIEFVGNLQKIADEPPTILATGNITTHMEKIRKAEEAMRCMAEATKFLELACMFHVKAMTA